MDMASASDATDLRTRFKQQAAERAVDFVESGMVLGLGTGSTAIFATRRVAQMLHDGHLRGITAVATSQSTRTEAERLGIAMLAEAMPDDIDLTIDGADEVDPEMNLIKGGGGALLREKIVAQASRRAITVIDESKLSPRLGTLRELPVEVLVFAWRSQARYLESLGAQVSVRYNPNGTRFVTDSGNLILDCRFGPIGDSHALAAMLSGRAGIIEHGLFLELATDLIIAGKGGVRHESRAG